MTMRIVAVFKFLALALLGLSELAPCHAEQEKQAPYNVLFIAIDDLRTELGCYGAEHIKSPNIDRLAANGVRFSGAHVQQAICMASRASIMSGIRPEKRGIYTGESVQDLLPGVMTLNKFFQQNGYAVSSCGKIYHYPNDTKEQFGDDYIKPTDKSVGAGYVTAEAIEKIKQGTDGRHGPAYECGDVDDAAYMDGSNTVIAVNRLKELKANGKPFFLAVGLTKPHLPFCAPKKYWDMYPEESIELAELRERPENSSKHTIRPGGELGSYVGMPQNFSEIDNDTELVLRRAYYACVSYADAQVGKLLDQLDTLGLRENTVVVLWGDHGYKLGDYGSWCKWSNMNIDTQIPLLFSVPNGTKGEVCNRVVEALDIYPTLAELCGLKKPKHVEGESLRPLLDNPSLDSDAEKHVNSIWPDNRWNYKKTVMGYAVKSERFNYVEWVMLSTGKVLERELYDHSNDPKETKNVIGSPEYSAVVNSLAELCKARKKDTDHDHAFKKLK
jgi:iduronate 2-sulfatase